MNFVFENFIEIKIDYLLFNCECIFNISNKRYMFFVIIKFVKRSVLYFNLLIKKKYIDKDFFFVLMNNRVIYFKVVYF